MHRFKTPLWIRWAAGLIGVVCAVAALPLMMLGISSSVWQFAAFQVLVLVSGIFSVGLLLGRFAEAPAMAIACIAGTILVAAVLGEPATAAQLIGTPAQPTVVTNALGTGIDISLLTASYIELGASLVLFALSGLAVLVRRPARSVRYLAWSAAWGLPVVLVVAASRIPTVWHQVTSVNAYVGTAGAVLGLFIGIALVSGCGHCFIRAMETGAADDDTPAT
ncbi:MAG: hypothetical protein AAGI30_00715 [Planctomycetota bacterium]